MQIEHDVICNALLVWCWQHASRAWARRKQSGSQQSTQHVHCTGLSLRMNPRMGAQTACSPWQTSSMFCMAGVSWFISLQCRWHTAIVAKVGFQQQVVHDNVHQSSGMHVLLKACNMSP